MYVYRVGGLFHKPVRLRILLFFPVVIFFMGAFFSLRLPVIVVSDAAFETLYGEKRSNFERGLFSLRIFRPVLPVLVSEGASLGASSEVAAAASHGGKAACVIFPTRFRTGAASLAAQFPETVVVVVGEIGGDGGLSECVILSPDRETDLYRAGKIAGILADGCKVVLRINGEQPSALSESFGQGLLSSPFAGSFSIWSADDRDPSTEESSFTIVDAGTVINPVPASVVFSWSDPTFLPKETLVVFDDSPAALLYQAYRAGVKKASAECPSVVRTIGSSKISLSKVFAVQAAARARRH